MTTTMQSICTKRLLGDIKLIKKNPDDHFDVFPDEKDLLTWYFLLKGPEDSQYKGGYYIGKIMHSPEYPFKPPDFMMLTPNGRFEINHKICLSNSGYHSDEWSSMWTIYGILQGFLSIMLDDKEHGISHISRSKSERAILAKDSINFNKKTYPKIFTTFERFIDQNGYPLSKSDTKSELISKPNLKSEIISKPKIDINIIFNKIKNINQIPEESKKLDLEYQKIYSEIKNLLNKK